MTPRCAALAALIALAAACGGAGDADTGPGPAGARGSATTVTLPPEPDASGMLASVREAFSAKSAPLRGTASDGSVPFPLRADALGRLGMLYMAAEFDDAAADALGEAHRIAPADARWPMLLGHLHRRAGRHGLARDAFEAAVTLAPDDPAPRVWLGTMQLELGESAAAEAAYRAALTIAPASASARYGLGRIALDAGRHEEAAGHLETVLALNPEANAAQYPLSRAYLGMGRDLEARQALARRGDVQPFPRDPLLEELETLLPDPQGANERGMQALAAGDLGVAETSLREAVAQAPDNPVFRVNLGHLYARTGRTEEARAEFERALELSPEEPRALVNLGTLASQAGRTDEALALYERAVAADPGMAEARVSLGAELRRAGRFADAAVQFARATEIDRSSEPAWLGAAMSLALTGKHAEARRACEDGLAAVGASEKLEHVLARLYAASPDDAVRDGSRAMALAERLHARPTIETAETLAMALAESGRFDEAAKLQRSVLASAERAGQGARRGALESVLALYESGRACREPWP